MTDDKQAVPARIATAVAVLAAGWLVQKLVDQAWARTRGHKPPQPDSPDAGIGEIAAAAAVTAVVAALVRVVVSRGAARVVARSPR